MTKAEIGILDGSGLYDPTGLERIHAVTMTTPFGKPSDDYVLGLLEGLARCVLSCEQNLATLELDSCPNLVVHFSSVLRYQPILALSGRELLQGRNVTNCTSLQCTIENHPVPKLRLV